METCNIYRTPNTGEYSIYLENVSFSYPNEDIPALQDINLAIPYDTHMALVGRTGAGKSTLISLLLGFNHPSKGRILSGKGITFSTEELRRMIAWVPQKPHLFRDTLAANLRLARGDASDDELVQAAQAAQLHDFILTLPEQYQTMIGEGGASLSAGQAQRLAIARAFLKNAPILLLDEPTSNLDPETEYLLEQSAVQWMRDGTVITIAHRLNTVSAADKIVVLNAGRIEETGTHAELLKSEGTYFSLFGVCKPPLTPVRYIARIPDSTSTTELYNSNSTFHEPSISPITWKRSTFIRLVEFLSGSWKTVSLSALLAALTTGSSVALLGASAWLISAAALHPSIGALSLAIVGVRFFGISRAVVRYLERLVSHRIALNILTRLRTWFYERLEPLAPARLMQFRSGDLLARIVSDINSLENFYVRVLLPPAASLLIVAFTSIYLSMFHPTFAWLQIAGFFIIGAVMPVVIHRFNRSLGLLIIKQRSDLNAIIVDGIQGLADLLILDQGDIHAERINRVSREFGKSLRRFARLTAMGSAGLVLFSGLTVWILLRMAIPLVNAGRMDGMMLAVLVLVCLSSFEALQPSTHIAQHWDTSRAAADRLFEIVDAKPVIEPTSKVCQQHRANLPGAGFHRGRPPALKVTNLTFSYPGNPWAALRNISFSLEHGRSMAIVGPSGAGKTTLINILLRFWEYLDGDIYLAGTSLKELSQEYIRGQLSVLNQNPWFFNASITENLKIAAPDASLNDIEKAASLVNMDETIHSLRRGYETIIGEQGLRLSAGECQRLALARVILKQAPMVILDEPTANLDPLTEAQILENLLEKMRNKAMIVITHRLVGMERFDEILVMNYGRIIECGTHNRLSAKGGLYAHLLNLQNRMIFDPDAHQAGPRNSTLVRL